MSNPLIDALAKEQGKLQRQLENNSSTKAVIEVLGETPRELNKLARQEAAIKETRSNIKKLQAALQNK